MGAVHRMQEVFALHKCFRNNWSLLERCRTQIWHGTYHHYHPLIKVQHCVPTIHWNGIFYIRSKMEWPKVLSVLHFLNTNVILQGYNCLCVTNRKNYIQEKRVSCAPRTWALHPHFKFSILIFLTTFVISYLFFIVKEYKHLFALSLDIKYALKFYKINKFWFWCFKLLFV